MTHEHNDRDTVVVRDSDSGMGLILGVIAIIVLVAAVWFFLMGPGAGTQSGEDTNVDVNLPSVEVPAAS